MNTEYAPSNIIGSRWRFVGAETFTARLEYRKVSNHDIRYVTHWNIHAKTKISMSPAPKTITGLSIDLERLFND